SRYQLHKTLSTFVGRVLYLNKRDLNLKKARAVKQNSPVDCFAGSWCDAVTASKDGAVAEHGRCEAAVSRYQLHKTLSTFVGRVLYLNKRDLNLKNK
ncbi:MAG: hypothetical protein IJN39_03690, partial [Clostridia bacterium]|nr:hypothetical protein [Clostridia bacterium]